MCTDAIGAVLAALTLPLWLAMLHVALSPLREPTADEED